MNIGIFEETKKRLATLSALSDSDKNSRIKSALNEFKYFVSTYLPHYIKGNTEETSEFRKWVYNELPNKIDIEKIIEIFGYRGASKSTHISRALTLWISVKKIRHYCIQISDGATLATDNLEAIRAEFEANQRLINDFNIQKGSIWSTGDFIVKINEHLMKFESLGSGSRTRGKNYMSYRPDWIIIDDLENDVNIEQKDQRDKLEKWVKRVPFKLADRNSISNIIILGTMLHPDSVLVRLSKRLDVKVYKFKGIIKLSNNLDMWQTIYLLAKSEKDDIEIINSKAYKSFIRNKSLLLDGLVVDDIRWLTKQNGYIEIIFLFMMEYFEDKNTFLAEIQMESESVENATFKPKFYNLLPNDLIYYFGIDPALGKDKEKGDYSALAILGKSKIEKKYYVVDLIYTRVHPDKFGELILKKAKEFKPLKIAIETVAFQHYYKDKLKEKAFSNTTKLPLCPINSRLKKELRIESLAPYINDGDILINQNLVLLKDELETFPKSKNDDGLDALEMAYSISFKGNSNELNQEFINKKNKFKAFKNKYL